MNSTVLMIAVLVHTFFCKWFVLYITLTLTQLSNHLTDLSCHVFPDVSNYL